MTYRYVGTILGLWCFARREHQDKHESYAGKHHKGMMSDAKPVQIDKLMLDLRTTIEQAATQHKYWEVRVHGSDGRARVEIIYQGATYNYRHDGGGEVITRRE